jgi:hypothetical protein
MNNAEKGLFDEPEPHFEQDELMIFKAVDSMASRYANEEQRRKFLSNELSRRALGHGKDPIELTVRFNKWKKIAA